MLSAELKKIRTAYAYSQEHMAGLLGVSRPTYADIEKGKTEVTVAALERLAQKTGLSLQSLILMQQQYGGVDLQPMLDKYKNMALQLIHYGADSDGKITKTKLAKLLYLSDFSWFYSKLQPMSGLQYRRIQYGPVPDQYFRILEELVEDNQIAIASGSAHMIHALEREPPQAHLTPEEIKQLSAMGKKWKNRNTADIVAFTHSQLPWKLCGDNELIPYELIIQEDPKNVC
jgi:transcriptional regulator with XRE-family HTH domain